MKKLSKRAKTFKLRGVGYQKGYTQSVEVKEKNRLAHLGKTHSVQTKEILSKKVHERLATGWSATKTAWKRILKEIPELEKQGFKCIPIINVIPDIIGIKNGKIYAIEVEYQRPKYSKYNNKIRKYYDDIIWLLRKKIK